MDILFTTISPMGYTVDCLQTQWDNHILIAHPNMKGKENVVESVISNPTAVYNSAEFPSRDIYFSESGNTNAKLRMCKVIVETDTDNVARIISAWMQPNISGNIGGIKYAKL